MTDSDTTTEEVTATRQVEPQAKGEAPQKVYNKKKAIFRFNQIIWYILGLIEVLLAFRIVLKTLGANSYSGFTSLIYALTAPLVTPFNGILGVSITGNSLIEWSTIIAAVVYLCVAWGFVYLMDLIYPITPRDVETA
ncbi:MAG: YggT family protein [Armatimonadetes bacterium]|nr:MAG: YggT family protein [Armatimonadota bacterium]